MLNCSADVGKACYPLPQLLRDFLFRGWGGSGASPLKEEGVQDAFGQRVAKLPRVFFESMRIELARDGVFANGDTLTSSDTRKLPLEKKAILLATR